MSDPVPPTASSRDPSSSAPSETKSNNKKKKRKGGAKNKANGTGDLSVVAVTAAADNQTTPVAVDGHAVSESTGPESEERMQAEEEEDASLPEIPTLEENNDNNDAEVDEHEGENPSGDGSGDGGALNETSVEHDTTTADGGPTNGVNSPKKDHAAEHVAAGTGAGTDASAVSTTDARLEALVKDRDALRAEVTELRKSIEELQAKHQTDVESLQEQLQDTQGEKEEAEEQYQNLLGKVNTIKSQLGERLKADAEDLSQARNRIEELEEQTSSLQEQYTAKAAELDTVTVENQTHSKELSSLRNRATLSQQNWMKEREELVEQEAYARDEFETAKQAMHDWEVLAMEERSIRRDLGEKVDDLEEQLTGLKEAYERAANERDSQSNTVDGLQKALQEIQRARKQELRELVESSTAEADTLRKQLQDAEKTSSTAESELEAVKKELERALPFEKEVKEKNLLIGKLRHEAVILNDHLTKALRFLKKGKPQDNVDRQLVTNHFLHFLALDRSDPKKFQILQLIASLLSWTDEQREQAGLSRPGTSINNSGGGSMLGSLRMPGSPLFHRTPSTPALTSSSSDYFPGGGSAPESSVTSPASKESLAELWQSFLEQEAQGNNVAATAGDSKSRSGSVIAESPKAPPKRYLYS